jgi:hypothetical protein
VNHLLLRLSLHGKVSTNIYIYIKEEQLIICVSHEYITYLTKAQENES